MYVLYLDFEEAGAKPTGRLHNGARGVVVVGPCMESQHVLFLVAHVHIFHELHVVHLRTLLQQDVELLRQETVPKVHVKVVLCQFLVGFGFWSGVQSKKAEF